MKEKRQEARRREKNVRGMQPLPYCAKNKCDEKPVMIKADSTVRDGNQTIF